MAESIDLKRFLDAQDGGSSVDKSRTAYEVALKEISDGEKTSHWIWYVFPQVPIGTSEMSQRYAISSLAEARAFLQNTTLRHRLLEISNAVADKLMAGVPPERLMGSSIDCKKLASSMTLFQLVAAELDEQELRRATARILQQLALHGWPKCIQTLEWISKS